MQSLKTLLIGLDGASPESLFEDERLVNLRRLMEAGCYGPLQSVIPPSSVPAWLCLVTGQDPGSLGIYGPRKRADRSYTSSKIDDGRTFADVAIRAPFLPEGGKTLFVAGPAVSPPAPSGTVDRISLRDEVVARTREHFAEVRRLLQQGDWNLLQFIEPGLDRLQRAFWHDHDPAHLLHEPESPHRDVVRDDYLLLDDELGRVLEVLDEETLVLVASTHGVQPCQGGFRVNQWLMEQGLLTLRHVPSEITPLDQLDIDWSKTKVWSEGGDCASLYFNVKGREPEGIVDPSEYESFRSDVKARLEAIADSRNRLMGTLVLDPEKIYRAVRNVAPDLIVQFGGMAWRAIDAVGCSSLYLEPDERGGESSSPSSQGAFVLAVPGLPGAGPVAGASLLDIAPTLLELGGREPLAGMQGRSLLGRKPVTPSSGSTDLDADELLIRERLSGLGYLG